MASADWYFDFDLPVRVPSVRAPGAHGAEPSLALSSGPICSAARRERPERTGGDRIQARVHLSLRPVAGEQARHRDPLSARASVQPAVAAEPCARVRLPARRHARIFRFVWRDGRLPDLPIEWAELAQDLGLEDAEDASGDPKSRRRCAATPTRRSRAASSACRHSRSATNSSGVSTRPKWRSNLAAGGCYDRPEYERVSARADRSVRARPPPPASKPSRGSSGALRSVAERRPLPPRRDACPSSSGLRRYAHDS